MKCMFSYQRHKLDGTYLYFIVNVILIYTERRKDTITTPCNFFCFHNTVYLGILSRIDVKEATVLRSRQTMAFSYQWKLFISPLKSLHGHECGNSGLQMSI